MKTIAVVLFAVAFVALVAANTREEQVKKAHEECQAEETTKVDVDALKKNKDDPALLAAAGKHAVCMNRKLGIMKPDGTIDKAVLKESLAGNDKAEEIVAECGDKKGSTPEETAIELFKCVKKHKPEHLHHVE